MSRASELSGRELRAALAGYADRLRDIHGRPRFDLETIDRLVARRNEPEMASLINAMLDR